uniref:Uncharacterized protein n=1 Tax=Cacopsylla melanoneura TaxID=428564 RepID=A0A8D8ZVG2_9HEMI
MRDTITSVVVQNYVEKRIEVCVTSYEIRCYGTEEFGHGLPRVFNVGVVRHFRVHVQNQDVKAANSVNEVKTFILYNIISSPLDRRIAKAMKLSKDFSFNQSCRNLNDFSTNYLQFYQCLFIYLVSPHLHHHASGMDSLPLVTFRVCNILCLVCF